MARTTMTRKTSWPPSKVGWEREKAKREEAPKGPRERMRELRRSEEWDRVERGSRKVGVRGKSASRGKTVERRERTSPFEQRR
jgi:hypothetical protein